MSSLSFARKSVTKCDMRVCKWRSREEQAVPQVAARGFSAGILTYRTCLTLSQIFEQKREHSQSTGIEAGS